MRGIGRMLIVSVLFVFYSYCSHGQSSAIFVEQYRFGQFAGAGFLETDPFGKIYVSDGAAHVIHKFSSNGILEQKIGGQGWETNQFDHPKGIDVRFGIVIYVADMGNHRIVRLDKNLNVMGLFSTRSDPQKGYAFGYPLDVVISKLGNLFILDGENNRVVSTSGFATVDNIFGGVESGKGLLRQPVAMTVSDEDNLYVLEQDRVVVFDVFGNYRFDFGKGSFQNAKGISIQEERCLVVTPDALFLFHTNGAFETSLSKNNFVFAEPTEEFCDAIFFDNKLLLLTAGNVILMSNQL